MVGPEWLEKSIWGFMVHSFIELYLPLPYDKAVIHEAVPSLDFNKCVKICIYYCATV